MAFAAPYYDVVIVGGGPAGCATALSIARHDPSHQLRILLLDNASPSAFKVGESLPASAKRTLSHLDPSIPARLAQETAAGLHRPCSGNASAWASARLHETYALMNLYGAGWHLDRARFDETLRASCGERLRKGRFAAVRRVDERDGICGWEIDAASPGVGPGTPETLKTFHTKWLVDATGRRASVARKLGAIQHKHHDLLAFHIVFSTSDDGSSELTGADALRQDTDDRTLIEAAHSGWWYTARLPQGKRLVTYTTSPTDPTARVARTTAGFLDMLRSDTRHIAHALGPGYDASALEGALVPYEPSTTARFTQCTAAGSSVLEPNVGWEPETVRPNTGNVGRGWCAVGDAALAFDPLSSQGIITALEMGALGGGVLARHLLGNPEAVSKGTGTMRSTGGQAVVDEIKGAYEQVRTKYEKGRAYYYDVVRRFDGAEAEHGGGEDGAKGAFWSMQRAGSSVD